MRFKDFFELARPGQIYKNLLIFLAIIFSGNLFNLDLFFLTLLGFVSLILVSSANYVLNDILDKKYDKKHPEKRQRPIASGKISIKVASVFFASLLLASFVLGFFLDLYFFICVVSLFLISSFYSLIGKKIIFLDLFLISINFVLRAIAGAFLIDVVPSFWLVEGVFFISLFLINGKRFGELCFFEEKDLEFCRKVLHKYNKKILKIMFLFSALALIFSFLLFSFLSGHKSMYLNIPFFVYAIGKTSHHIIKFSDFSRAPEKLIKDKSLLIAFLVFLLISLISIYLL